MTISQQPSEKENSLNTRNGRKYYGRLNDGIENYDDWPTEKDNEDKVHHGTPTSEAKAKHAAQTFLQRRYNNSHGKATARVIGRASNAHTQSKVSIPASASSTSSYYSHLNSRRRPRAATRRRMFIYGAIGVALVGYFFEIVQLTRKISTDDGSQNTLTIDLPHSFSLPYRVIENNPPRPGDIELSATPHRVIPSKDEWDRVKSIIQNRTRQRRMRSRPPNKESITEPMESTLVSKTNSGIIAPRLILDLPAHRFLNEITGKAHSSKNNNNIRGNTEQSRDTTICGIHARDASKNDSSNFPNSAHIGPGSRVIVTGALTQLGMEVILQLYKDCGTEYILGIDPILPNTQHDRLAALDRYRYLHQHVPSLQKLYVPHFGVAPHSQLGDEISIGRNFDIIDKFSPTHIVHLMGLEEGRGEYSAFGDTHNVSPYGIGGNSSMMRRFLNLESMEQLLASIARIGEPKSKVQPQLVYVSSTEVENESGVSSVSEMREIQRKASVYGSCSLFKEVLASFYHVHYGVESVGVRLSTVYGPFARPGSLMHDLADQLIYNAVENNGGKLSLESMWMRRKGAEVGAVEQISYATDLAQAFVAAMQFRFRDVNGPALMQLGSKDTKSMREIERETRAYLALQPEQSTDEADAISTGIGATLDSSSIISDHDLERNLDLLGWAHTTKTQDGLKSMLDWHILKDYPFVQPKTASSLKEFLDLSPFPEVGMSTTLPCVSGCGWHGRCIPSAWDAVVEESKAATTKCKYVLYTVDLSIDLVELKDKPTKSKEKKDFCSIAFISSSSVLAKRSNDSQWTIITVDGDESNMTEAELSLAKLSPTLLFGDKASHAFYVNHRKLKAGIDDALFGIRGMKMDSVKERTRKIVTEFGKTKKFWLEPRAKRHSVMFANRVITPKEGYANNVNAHAQFVMSNFDVEMTEKLRKQVKFYEHASHLIRNGLLRSPNYADNAKDIKFSFEYLRSYWLAHALKSEEGRQLRCEIYEEHVTWSNKNMEDFSMAFVLAKRSALLQHGKLAETGDSLADWYPLFSAKKSNVIDEDLTEEGPEYLEYLDPSRKDIAKNHKGSEVYISFLSKEL